MSETHASPARFRSTRWSLVQRSQGQGEEAHRALEELCQAYWFPLYAWARRSGSPAADAEDLVQSFFVQVLTKDLFASADSSRGKLRTFLLTAFRRHVKDERAKATAERRGGGRVLSFDATEAESWFESESREGESADHLFDRQWALTVLDQAIGRLEKQAASRNREKEFAAMRPLLTSENNATDYERVAIELGMKTNTVKVAIHRWRNRFAEALRAEIVETQPDETDPEEELAWLLRALA